LLGNVRLHERAREQLLGSWTMVRLCCQHPTHKVAVLVAVGLGIDRLSNLGMLGSLAS